MARLPVLPTLLALCLSALFLAACGSSSEDPQQVLERAGFEGLESADFNASASIESAGGEDGDLKIDVSGRALSEGVDIDATVAGTALGKPVDFEGGLTLLADHGFVNYR